MLSPNDLQLQTLRLYGELVSRRLGYGGKLIFTSGSGSSATGLPTAVSIAGGTTLALDPDASTVKSVFRQGGVDFVVTTLDEALRVLKNEIRQHRPLGVALIADIDPVLAEMTERGVLPDLHVSIPLPGDPPPDVQAAQHLHLAANSNIVEATPHLMAWLETRGWVETLRAAIPEVPLRAVDALLLAGLAPEDTLRRHWLQRISHYQRSSPDGTRAFWAGVPRA